MPSESQTDGWTRVPITSLEDLSDVVLGAGLEVTQMSRAPVTGSLAYAALDDGLECASGYIGGRVALSGPLSASMVTLGIGLDFAPGTRHWLNEVTTGVVGVFLPGDEHDAFYPSDSMYAAVTLTAERLEEIAARRDLVLDARTLGGTRIDAHRKLPAPELSRFQKHFERIHAGQVADTAGAREIGMQLLDSMIQHFARSPRFLVGGHDPHGLARIVARARAFIHAHLDQPLSVEKIANAAATSHRTLHRAFHAVLDETPYSYVLKLRLHRIRHELITDAEAACTITMVAHRWNIAEMGRFSASYRDLFGELPSQTVMRHQQSARHHPQATEPGEGGRILTGSA